MDAENSVSRYEIKGFFVKYFFKKLKTKKQHTYIHRFLANRNSDEFDNVRMVILSENLSLLQKLVLHLWQHIIPTCLNCHLLVCVLQFPLHHVSKMPPAQLRNHHNVIVIQAPPASRAKNRIPQQRVAFLRHGTFVFPVVVEKVGDRWEPFAFEFEFTLG